MKGWPVPTATILVAAGLILFGFVLITALYGAPASPTGAPLVSSTSTAPVRLLIPALSVDAKVQQVGLTKNGQMGIPTNFTDVAWYKHGSVPGAAGNAVIAGHVDNALRLPGVFKHLDELKPGDVIEMVNASGQKLTFAVTRIEHLPADTKDTADVFRTSGDPGLVLVTCEGVWDQKLRQYSDRLVIFSALRSGV